MGSAFSPLLMEGY